METWPAGTGEVLTWNIWWRFGPHWQDRQPALLGPCARSTPMWSLCRRSGEMPRPPRLTSSPRSSASMPVRGTVLPSGFRRTEGRRRGVHAGTGVVEPVADRECGRVEMPARHRPFSPVAIVARLQHPDGLLSSWSPAWSTSLPITTIGWPSTCAWPISPPIHVDGALPIIVAGDLNAAPTQSRAAPSV